MLLDDPIQHPRKHVSCFNVISNVYDQPTLLYSRAIIARYFKTQVCRNFTKQLKARRVAFEGGVAEGILKLGENGACSSWTKPRSLSVFFPVPKSLNWGLFSVNMYMYKTSPGCRVYNFNEDTMKKFVYLSFEIKYQYKVMTYLTPVFA